MDIPQTQITEKAEDEGGKGAQSISSFMLKGVKGFFSMQKPPDKANDQVGIPPQSNNVPHMFPPGLSHLLPDGSENIESELLPLDRQPNFEELVKNMIGDTPKIREWYERGLSKSNKDLGRMMARYTDKELGRMMARSGLLLLEFLRYLALVNSGIIHANLGCNIEVAKVWNGMCKLIDKKIKYEPIDKAIYDVKNFYTNKYKTMCTEFYRTHFLKPWSAISFFAACILFALAGFQTYLAWEQVRLQRESMPKT